MTDILHTPAVPGGDEAGGADRDLLAVCVAIAPYLGATEANDWRGLEHDDAICMPVKMRVGDLRALKAAIAKATQPAKSQQEGEGA